MKSVTDKSRQSTRDIILHTIKQHNRATVETLAEAANVSPVTVRHHLNSLQADNLLQVDSVRRKVGRPYYVYSLSEKGHELFPKKYVRLSSRLLDEIKERFPESVVVELFQGVVQGVVREHRKDFHHLDFEERLDYLVELLAQEGFLARWEKTDTGYQFVEYSCPYISVGQTHTEVCTFDRNLILSVLETDVRQHSCMLHGDSCCEFSIDTKDAPRPAKQTIELLETAG